MTEEVKESQGKENQTPQGGKENLIPQERLDAIFAQMKEAKEEAQKLKDKIKKEEENKLAEQGKYKELLGEREKELERLKAEQESLKAEVEHWQKYQMEQKGKLLEKLPESEREKLKNLGLQELETVVNLTAKQSSNDPKFRAGIVSQKDKFDGYPDIVSFAEAMKKKGAEGIKHYHEVVNELKARGEL
jgi:predicted RNase H-like nuclease (RuvC/YqgF family)